MGGCFTKERDFCATQNNNNNPDSKVSVSPTFVLSPSEADSRNSASLPRVESSKKKKLPIKKTINIQRKSVAGLTSPNAATGANRNQTRANAGRKQSKQRVQQTMRPPAKSPCRLNRTNQAANQPPTTTTTTTANSVPPPPSASNNNMLSTRLVLACKLGSKENETQKSNATLKNCGNAGNRVNRFEPFEDAYQLTPELCNLSRLHRDQSLPVNARGVTINQESVPFLLSHSKVERLRQNSAQFAPEQALIMYPPFSNMDRIVDGVYLTGIHGLLQENFAKENIKLIINSTTEMPLIRLGGFESFRVPVDDTVNDANISDYFDDVADLIEYTRLRGKGSVVHCHAGVSRSSTLILAYLIKFRNLNLSQAFRHVYQIRPVIFPNLTFFNELRLYEKRLLGRCTVQILQYGKCRAPDIYKTDYPKLFEREIFRQENQLKQETMLKGSGQSKSDPILKAKAEGKTEKTLINQKTLKGGNKLQTNYLSGASKTTMDSMYTSANALSASLGSGNNSSAPVSGSAGTSNSSSAYCSGNNLTQQSSNNRSSGMAMAVPDSRVSASNKPNLDKNKNKNINNNNIPKTNNNISNKK